LGSVPIPEKGKVLVFSFSWDNKNW
jgi:hypothetical protein